MEPKLETHDFKNAYNYLVKLLSKKDYSQYKLKNKLSLKGFEEHVIDSAIETAISKKILNENNYTEFIIKKHMLKGFSPEYISHKLNNEGIEASEDKIQSYFEENEVTTTSQIKQLLSEKLPHNLDALEENERIKAIRRASMFISSKGHHIDITEFLS